jgi:AAA+ ATPase superfamily predicted ATPase
MKFIGRTRYLKYLNERWESEAPEFTVVYGRRRVGKTELIKHYIDQKAGIYFLADRRPAPQQLRQLGIRVGQFFDDPVLARNGFSDWVDLFEYIKTHAKTRFILAIDEYPYLTETDPAVGSLFQKGWDEYLRHVPIHLILCGSSIAMMESETLRYRAPLYGRSTGQLFVKPLSFAEAHGFFPTQSFDEQVKLFAITGGMPAYLNVMAQQPTIEEGLSKHVLDRDGRFHAEVELLLREELREPKTYLMILEAIALGKHRFGEISNATGMPKSALTIYLKTLANLQMVEKTVPVTDKIPEKSKISLYRLSDPFFRVWFNYVFPFKSELELDDFQLAMGKLNAIQPHLEALAYEDICREWIWDHRATVFTPQKVGRWWDKNTEIDIVAIGRENNILFGEVKWSKNLVGVDIVASLKEKSRFVKWGKAKRLESFILFSRSGFTDALRKQAESEKIILVHGAKVSGQFH